MKNKLNTIINSIFGICFFLISFNIYAVTSVQVAELVSGDPVNGDLFGWSVDVDGDTAIIGANHDDALNGGVYIFVRTPGTKTWIQQEKLQKVTVAGEFGFSVAIDGDIAVVGAYQQGFRGEAYVYRRKDTLWDAGVRLNPGDGLADNDVVSHERCNFCEQFGRSVAISGTTIVVGSMFDNYPLGLHTGAAYVFIPDGSSAWKSDARVNPGSGLANVEESTVINGTNFRDIRGVLIPTKSSGGILGQEYDHFGSAVAIDGNTIIVGAENANHSVEDQKLPSETGCNTGVTGDGKGTAFSFVLVGDVWSEPLDVINEGSRLSTTAKFGHAVAVQGNTAVIGAYIDNTDGGCAGSAFVYSRTSSSANWSLSEKLTSPGGANTAFGTAVAVHGDNLLVGAPLSNTVYRFSLSLGGAPSVLPASSSNTIINYGQSVAITADSNSTDTFLVGAPAGGAGSAFIFVPDLISSRGQRLWRK